MNLDLLNTQCKKATKSAYDDFKHFIDNPLFELNENIYDIHLNDMKMKAGTKVYKWYLDNHSYSEAQFRIVNQLKNKYIYIAERYAYSYSKKQMK
ncbi:hypothetical protein [Winogradskyella sp. UBA3174]|uniref:hypothetical protein n=1 Tax=Winogradskyella sp. UBA3174 TaxID=1947785 RepID=UPI0025E04230|nr:hypothetical protein [Winogradskyella sp. UBA3174]|tara:strand:- start:10678 stop:10962 length:285 start_codon:yes stop_codon:yes gene_type:complete